jgi:menaquinone-dependent protoporphyrinogen IX oxidase
MKILVTYGTRWGATEKTARLMADVINQSGTHSAEAISAARVAARSLAAFDAFVVGSSIAAGQWKGSAKRMVHKLAGTGKPVAAFVCAAGVLSPPKAEAPGETPPPSTLAEREAQAVALYVDTVCAKAGLDPVAKGAFGGKMTMFGKVIIDNWDAEPVKAWTRDLVERF